eukprot:TRINITY_DN18779_c0_g1_i1.p2 TRINITY_DN18779_c0_g1~~TRINITY_DN18779_c0_g1_i1.p2  ORF type:complete len:206 (+),score=44.63 TRINITY_DN18779_c0_g1_i1:1620-2237(+)
MVRQVDDIPLWEWPWNKKATKQESEKEVETEEVVKKLKEVPRPLLDVMKEDVAEDVPGGEVFELLHNKEGGLGLTVDANLQIQGVLEGGSAEKGGLGGYLDWKVVRCNGKAISTLDNIKALLDTQTFTVCLVITPPPRAASSSGGGSAVCGGGLPTALHSPLKSFNTVLYDISPMSTSYASPNVSPVRWKAGSPTTTTIKISPAR